jgi:predicted DNA-binding protein (MmcQ/YjbR family)
MDLESFRSYCLSKKGVTEEFPFGEDIFVYKVCGKIFAITSLDFPSINLKAEPEQAIDLRERYSAVQPGYHMNKTHWNTVLVDGSLPNPLLLEFTDTSYNLIVKSFNKSQKLTFDSL